MRAGLARLPNPIAYERADRSARSAATTANAALGRHTDSPHVRRTTGTPGNTGFTFEQ